MIRYIVLILLFLSGISGKVRAFSESHGKVNRETKISAVEKLSPCFQNDSGTICSFQIISRKDSLLLPPALFIQEKFPDTISGVPLPDSPLRSAKPRMRYTIQICSMSFPLSDSFFKGQYGVKVMRMGDLYRYVYSVYDSLSAARKDLPKVRKIYPDAFIREFDENKLGKAIDLKIEHLK